MSTPREVSCDCGKRFIFLGTELTACPKCKKLYKSHCGSKLLTEDMPFTIRDGKDGTITLNDKDKGAKHDQGKLRMDLIPVYPLRQWAEVLTFGAEKYEDRNWEKDIAWSRVYAAAQRHLLAFWDGEDKDEESHLPHLAHAMCCLSFLLEYSKTYKEGDDRPSKLPKLLKIPICPSCGHDRTKFAGSYVCLSCAKPLEANIVKDPGDPIR